MKKQLLDLLVCPACLPREHPLVAEIVREQEGDIDTAILMCQHCGARFPVTAGIALLDPHATDNGRQANKYETAEVVSSYLWSQYGDLLDDDQASTAYATWAGMMRPQAGVALDAGGAVGRFAFEMSGRCDFAIGIDTSVAFIRAARQLMQERSLTFALKEEGQLGREATIRLPDDWRSERVDFLVANALALPLRRDAISLFASLNLVDKVPAPLDHLREMNRVTRDRDAQFLLSDPFSGSVEAAPPQAWLGGTAEGRFAGRGQANIARLLADPAGELAPAWRVDETGHVWWKIRTHANHYELIRSCFIRACR